MALLDEMRAEPEIIYELIITIINLLSILANVILVITIARTRSMRSRTNLYILNVSIADLFTLVVLLVYYIDKRIVRYSHKQPNYNHIQCVLTNLEMSLQIATVAFVVLLVTNCLYNCKCIAQGISIVLMWNILIIIFYINVLYCKDDLTFIQGAVYALSILILMLILFGKYYLRCRNKGDVTRDGAFRLNFATIFMCLCLTSWVVNIAAEFTLKYDSIFKHFILAFGTSVRVGKNIALACYLFKYNEGFKDSLLALFNCRSVKINESVNYSTDQTSIDVSIRNEKI